MTTRIFLFLPLFFLSSVSVFAHNRAACSDSFRIYSEAGTILKNRVEIFGDIGSNQYVEAGVESVVNGNLESVGNAVFKSKSTVNGVRGRRVEKLLPPGG